jgi:hypothetical protein
MNTPDIPAAPDEPQQNAPRPDDPEFIGPLQPEQMFSARRYWYDETGQAHFFVGDGDSHLELKPAWKSKRSKL